MLMRTPYSRRRRIALATASFASYFIAGFLAIAAEHSYKPPQGYIPDERTAIAVAEAVLVPIYGAEQIAHERPFHGVLRGDVWEVSGSLPRGWVGGVALVRIDKEDGRILRVTHGK
jgi:hypothetical protein